jgi:hypothetical protein
MNFVLPALLLAGLTLSGATAWWLMARRPELWARWVDRENDFWRERGRVSPALAERMKRWEKGPVLRFLAAGSAIIGAIGLALTLAVLLKVMAIQHQKIRMPYNPFLQQKSGHR